MATRVIVQFEPFLPVATAVSYPAGARINGEQLSTSTATVHSGHGIVTGSKSLYALTESNILTVRVFTAGTVTSTTVPFTGDTFSFPNDALLLPLGSDTGGVLQDDGSYSRPNYDASTINMFSDSAGDDTIASATVKPTGDASHYVDTVPVWVLGLDGGTRPVQILQDIGVTGGGGGGSSITRGAAFPATPTLGDQHLLIVDSKDILYTYMTTSSGNDWVEGISAP